jgi:hypothetical protein
MATVSGFGLVVMLLAVALLYLWIKAKAHDEVFREAARSLRFRARAGGLVGRRRLSGRMGGFKVFVDGQAVDRKGKADVLPATRYRVYYPSLGLGLVLQRDRGGLGSLRDDIEVGDAKFDEQLVVEGDDPDAIRGFLTPERRYRILRVLRAFRSCRISDQEIRCVSHGPDDNPALIKTRVKGLVQLAELLTARREAKLEPALVARRRGDYARAHRVAKAQPDEDVDARVAEAEMLVASRRLDEAKQVLETVREALPGDEQVEEMRQTVDEPPPAPERSEEDADEDAVAASVALFGAGLSSVDVGRLFAERYEGRRVRWTGTLEEATEYMSDFVFGREPGTRAVVKLHEIEQGYFGVHEVRAVLQMPPGNAGALRSWEGQAFTFKGTLLRVDPFVRNVFVSEATVA